MGSTFESVPSPDTREESAADGLMPAIGSVGKVGPSVRQVRFLIGFPKPTP